MNSETVNNLFSDDCGSFFRSPVREIFKRVDLNSIYSFAGGYPSADTFPIEKFGEIMADVLKTQGAKAFQYGATQGVTELREAVSRRYDVPVENIQITTSSQQGIDVVSRVLLNPGDVVLTSNPAYLGALQSFCSYRSEICGVNDRRTKSLDEYKQCWENAINNCRGENKHIKFLYVIPDFQNPSGDTLSVEQRRFLISLARRNGFLILEDSPYKELRYSGEPLPSIYSMAPDVTIHLGSFSKIMAPGFRLGWIFARTEILDKIFVCKQSLDLCPPIFDQYVAAEFMDSGLLDENLKKSIELYRRKRDLMLSLLNEYMPEGVSWTKPDGGLFLFLTLPEGFNSVEFYETALSSGVAYVAGSFFHTDGSGLNTMRLSFSFMTEQRMREGIELLGSLLKTALKKS